jgi:predicted  nucleic acid-binding Zn-ribbon protein
VAEKKDEKIEEALEGMKDHASSISRYVDSFKQRIEDLEKQKAEAEEKAAKAEERIKNAEEQHAEALKKLGQAEARESSNYAPLIRELFREPQQELQRQMMSQGLWFLGLSLAVVALAIFIGVSVISFYSVKSMRSAANMTPAAPTQIEAKLVQALAHLDEKTQKSIDRISLETAKIAEDISYITRERRLVEEIAMEIEKFQHEFAPVRTRNDVRLLYKMRLSPHHQAKYALFYEALKASSLPADLVPTNLSDFYIWDRQMLHIFTRLLRKVESAQYEYGQLPNEILRFSNYKDVIDATKYGVWSIEIEEYSQLVAYLGKQIELYKKQILLNNREL